MAIGNGMAVRVHTPHWPHPPPLVSRHRSATPLCTSITNQTLRPIHQKIRIVKNLLVGAHISLFDGGKLWEVPAVPALPCGFAYVSYNTDDASRMEGLMPTILMDSVTFRTLIYKHLIVFFILPLGQQQQDQLGQGDSFVNNTAQKYLLRRDEVVDENGGGKKV